MALDHHRGWRRLAVGPRPMSPGLLPQPGGFEARSVSNHATVRGRAGVGCHCADWMTSTNDRPVVYMMLTDDQARARRRATRLNELRRSESFSWEVRQLPNGRFVVVALAKE